MNAYPRIPANHATADSIRDILHLPHDRFSPIEVRIGEAGAVCALEILLTDDELLALSELAVLNSVEGAP